MSLGKQLNNITESKEVDKLTTQFSKLQEQILKLADRKTALESRYYNLIDKAEKLGLDHIGDVELKDLDFSDFMA